MARYGNGQEARQAMEACPQAGVGRRAEIPVRRYGTVPPPPAELRAWNEASPRRWRSAVVLRGGAAVLFAGLCAAAMLLLTR